MAVKISKRYSYSYNSFSSKRFLNVPCDSPNNNYIWYFEISDLNLKKRLKRLKFIIVANGKMKNCQYLGNG